MNIAKNREREDLALQAYGALKVRALDKKLLSYLEVTRLLNLPSPQQVGAVLKMVMDECHSRGEPLYPAIVVNRHNHPGEGFYKQARGLGYQIPYDVAAERDFWLDQLQQLGMYEAVYAAQNPEDTLWGEGVSFLKELGYEIEYKPLVGNGLLPGRQLVEVVPHRPEQLEINPINAVIQRHPAVREYLETGVFRTDDKPGKDRIEAFKALRKELQFLVLHTVSDHVSSQVLESLASRLPVGEGPATASQLPGGT